MLLKISTSINCDKLKPMLTGGIGGYGYPGKFGQRVNSMMGNQFGLNNAMGNQFAANNLLGMQYGLNNGMNSQMMGLSKYPGKFNLNLAATSHSGAMGGGYPLKLGQKLGLSGK